MLDKEIVEKIRKIVLTYGEGDPDFAMKLSITEGIDIVTYKQFTVVGVNLKTVFRDYPEDGLVYKPGDWEAILLKEYEILFGEERG